MFAARYFGERFYPTRYYVKASAIISITRFVELALGARPSYGASAPTALAAGAPGTFTLSARPSYAADAPPALTIEGED